MEAATSVVVSCHNKVKHIGACLDAVLAQRPEPDVLVVNDGSTDGSTEVIRLYMDRVGVITNTRAKGVCSARNIGKQWARGENILFLDGDMVLDEGILARMETMLGEESDVAFVYGDYDRAGEWAQVFPTYEFKSKPFDLNELCVANYISAASLVRNYDWLAWDESIERLNDWDFWLTLALRGLKGKYLGERIFTAWFENGDISLRGGDDYDYWYKKVAGKHRRLIEEGAYENTGA